MINNCIDYNTSISNTAMKLVYLILFIFLHSCYAVNNNTFPKEFMFGTATAAYQIEGGWNEDGKGENIWDYLTHNHPEYIKDRSNGDNACASYHKYLEDVELLRTLGVDFYRFSLSWSRILPTGFPNKINKKGIEYYNNLINQLKKYNIEPIITLYHWDLPQPLQDLGGYANENIVTYFKDYAKVVFDHFGDRVRYWITFNEPTLVCQIAYTGKDSHAPSIPSSGIGDYMCTHNLLKAHAAVYHLYTDIYKPQYKGKISIVLETTWYEAGSNKTDDIEAQERKLQFNFGLYANPIFWGDYPKLVKERIAYRSLKEGFPRSRLPEFTKQEIEFIKGTHDFLGLNTYTTNLIKDDVEANFDEPSHNKDVRVNTYVNETWPGASSSWLKVYPDGMRKLLVWLKNTYNNTDILITENGYSDYGEIDDTMRINYYRDYLSAVLDAIYDHGVNVIGYTAWSLVDNFEWLSGYTEKFGLFHVDFNNVNRTRTQKNSAKYYATIIKTRCLLEKC